MSGTLHLDALQTAIYSLLSTDATLDALGVSVFDHVPANTDDASTFPYIVIGDNDARDFDTDTTLGSENDVQIDSWSRKRGRKQTNQIIDAVYGALNRVALAVSGANMLTVDYQNSQNFVEPDGLTRHGVITFRILLDETG